MIISQVLVPISVVRFDSAENNDKSIAPSQNNHTGRNMRMPHVLGGKSVQDMDDSIGAVQTTLIEGSEIIVDRCDDALWYN